MEVHSLDEESESPLNGKWLSIRNEVDRLSALIEGNYSFAQDAGIFVCVGFTPRELMLRYLGQLHNRLQRELQADLRRSPSPIEAVEAVSAIAQNVFVVVLELDETGYIAFNGEILASGVKSKGWRVLAGREDWENTAKKALEVPEGKLAAGSSWPLLGTLPEAFRTTLIRVVEMISKAPGKGAMFVIGPYNNGLKSRSCRMTPVFEMVQSWGLDELAGDARLLYQLSLQDGATIIATDTNQQSVLGRMHLVAIQDDGRPFDPSEWPDTQTPLLKQWNDEKSPYHWTGWGRWFRWGTRHKTAAGLSYVGKGKYLAICISADGPVHIFDGYRVAALFE